MLLTFVFVTFAWIFFRIHSLGKAIEYVKQIVVDSIQHPRQFFQVPEGVKVFYYIVPLILIELVYPEEG